MPELPEVETTMNGIRPYVEGVAIRSLVVRERGLRWPIIAGLENIVKGKIVSKLQRRGKYILLHIGSGGLLIHLGMSGSLRVLLSAEKPGKHDHFDLVNDRGEVIRYRDPRKFGSLLFSPENLFGHPRICSLGVEPLTKEFDADLLYKLARNKSVPVKTFIMDGRIVVGVGNIYASEALFDAGIHPLRRCSNISLLRYKILIKSIKNILNCAISKGGTTLQDFVGADGSPGYFVQSLAVYGRDGQSCSNCQSDIKKRVISQRSTFFCSQCQK